MTNLPDKEWLLARVGAGRGAWRNSVRPSQIESVSEGEESVWDYPRPPELRQAMGPVRVEHAGQVIARSDRALRVVETAGAPVYFVPPQDVSEGVLRETDYVTVCEWKGAAVHHDLVVSGVRVEHAAFTYPDPLDDLDPDMARIAGWIAFYPARVDACFVGDEKVRPQPGGYYAGWVTSAIKGPIKGNAGTQNW